MRKLVVLFVLVIGIFCDLTLCGRRSTACDPEKCVLPSCRCSSVDIPGGLAPEETPQFVLLTFDDAVSVTNMPYYREIFSGRRNPNDCKIGGTFFVSHEWTDYQLVNELYADGNEIALHSISHVANTNYWKKISVEDLTVEFVGERELISKFARIPIEDIQGIRIPFLQLSGNNSYHMMHENNFKYDISWPTQNYIAPGLWPYTLDYRTTQECPVGPCPTEELPATWVIPMLDWKDVDGNSCAMLDSCSTIPETTEEVTQWMIENFEHSYKSNKAPFGVYTHAAFFMANEEHFEAYQDFVTYLLEKDDVFLVTASDLLKWVENPIPLSEMQESEEWSTCRRPDVAPCKKKTCRLQKDKSRNSDRYFSFCGTVCPDVYPWLDNPLGEEDDF